GERAGDEAELRGYVRGAAIAYDHQVGTAKMGVDEMAVVTPRLRVRGVEGLSVADASVMPQITTGNTNAPSVLIGEQAARFLLGDRKSTRLNSSHVSISYAVFCLNNKMILVPS